MSSRRPYRSAAQWQALVHRQAKSALSAREFCDAQDLSYASFIQWRSRLRQESATRESDAADFIELTGTATSPPSPVMPAQEAVGDTPVVVELLFGTGITLRISQSR